MKVPWERYSGPATLNGIARWRSKSSPPTQPPILIAWNGSCSKPGPFPISITPTSPPFRGGVHFITMEILQGRKLDSLIPQNGFSAARFFDIAIRLVDSIGAAREVGVIIRSLNPRNIMWTNDGIVKILRFGLVRNPKAPGEESGPDVLNPELREGASAEGKTPYASPEELAGRPRDHRSEMYSLGVLFYEMLTGFRPFSAEKPRSCPQPSP